MELQDYVGKYGVLNEVFKRVTENYSREIYKRAPHQICVIKKIQNDAMYPFIVDVLDDELAIARDEIDILSDNDPIINLKVGQVYDHHFNKGVIQMIDYKYRKMELKFDDGSSEVIDVPTVEQTAKRETVDVMDVLHEMYGNDAQPQHPVDGDMLIHKGLLDKLHEVIKAKRSDYGDSFGKQYDEYGILSALIRLDDKLNRLKSLTIHAKTQQVNDESTYDTVLDLMGYASLLLLRLEKEKQNAS